MGRCPPSALIGWLTNGARCGKVQSSKFKSSKLKVQSSRAGPMSKLKKIRGSPRPQPGPLSQETGHYPQVLLLDTGAILSAREDRCFAVPKGRLNPTLRPSAVPSGLVWQRGNFFGCGLAALFVSILCPRSIAADAPQPPTGWRIELVAQAPEIRHPSVVCVSPDDRVFVAEDPMDISTPHADAQEGRILCLQPDGRRTVFAEKLHAIFGMQYLEGRLYVLH